MALGRDPRNLSLQSCILDPGGAQYCVWHRVENLMEFHISTCAESKARKLRTLRPANINLEMWKSIGLSIDQENGLPKFIYYSLVYHTRL